MTTLLITHFIQKNCKLATMCLLTLLPLYAVHFVCTNKFIVFLETNH